MSYPLQLWVSDYQWYCKECERVSNENSALTYQMILFHFLQTVQGSDLAHYRAVRFSMAVSFLHENLESLNFGKAAVAGESGNLISIELVIVLHQFFSAIPDDRLASPVSLEDFIVAVKKAWKFPQNLIRFDFIQFHTVKQPMPKTKPAKNRYLPDWADKPLGFAFNPEAALKQGAFSTPPKVQVLKKSVRLPAKSRR